MPMPPFQGSITALITPFKYGKVDAAAFQKLIEWQIAIERVDNPLAISPCMRPEAISAETIGIRVARLIEPMAAPLFSIVR